MHEIGLMQETLSIAFDHAARAGATRIHRMTVRVGVLSGVEPDALTFAFSALSNETIAAGARFDVESVAVTCFCESCAEEFQSEGWVFDCPRCGQLSSDVRRGRELELAELEVS